MTLCDVVGHGVLAAALWVATPALGQGSGDEERAEAEHGETEAESLVWNERWTRFQPWEYVATPTLLAVAITARLGVELGEANWTGGILFDDALTDRMRARDPAVRETWTLVGDVPFYAAIVFPHVDAFVSAGLLHGAWDVAAQLELMNTEAFVLAGAAIWFTQLAVRRERPRVSRCEDGGYEPGECEEDRLRSFPGGHVLIATTAAALTCTHHAQLALWSDPGADAMACGIVVTAAVVTAVSRTVVSAHYFSDNLAGAVLGVLFGWLVPTALHYGFDSDGPREIEPRAEDATAGGTEVVLMPFGAPRPDSSGAVGGVLGVF
jgi:membrane-associated phospholipid phosphatase